MQRIVKQLQSRRASYYLNLLVGFSLACIGLLMIAITFWEMRAYALDEAEEKAQITLARNLATHAYFTQLLKPAIFQIQDQALPDGYFDPIWMSSTYAVREIDTLYRLNFNNSNYYYKEAAVNARNPKNEAVSYEREFLLALQNDPTLQNQSDVRVINGEPYFVVMVRGETMKEQCLLCHSDPAQAPAAMLSTYGTQRSFGRQVGEVVSAVSIRIPLAVAYQAANTAGSHIAGILTVMLLAIFLGHRWLTGWLVLGPLERVRSKALEITADERRLGEQIPLPFGDELRGLTAAFNQLSLSLRHHEDEMKERIQTRTRELEHSQRLVQKMLDTTPSHLSLWDATNNRFIYANSNMAKFYGCTQEGFKQLKPEMALEAVHPNDQAAFAQFLKVLNSGQINQSITVEYRARNSQGEWRWVSCQGLVFQDERDGQARQVLFSADDVTENREAREHLRFISTHDALTGLYNWAYFQEALEQVQQEEAFPAAIIIMDVDNLKKVNDTFGHDAGNVILREIAELLRDGFRAGDVVARVGGDEFSALLPKVNQADAREIIQRMQALFRTAASATGLPLDLLSFGLSVARDATELKAAQRQADQRMYIDKQQRKQIGAIL